MGEEVAIPRNPTGLGPVWDKTDRLDHWEGLGTAPVKEDLFMDVRDFDDYRLLRMPEVMAITGLSKNTIRRLVKAGLFLKPI